jgi:hypothetical protein
MKVIFEYTYYYTSKKIKILSPSKYRRILLDAKFCKDKNSAFIKELLRNNLFDSDKANSNKRPWLQDFSGFQSNDTEKTVFNYKKCFALIRLFDFFRLQILFLGKPLLSELFLKNLSLKSRHVFLLNEDWLFGFLTNKQFFPKLIISFKSDIRQNEVLKTPYLCFINSFELEESSFICNNITDYLFSLKYFSSVIFFFSFLKHLVLNKNGKR